MNKDIEKYVLDPASGGRMFYFDKQNPLVTFGDIRNENYTAKDGKKIREININPDEIMDFRAINYGDDTFSLVVYDPPHMKSLGSNSWMAKKYGRLYITWQDDLRKGFSECFRVLKNEGTLVFKWNEYDIPVKDILELADYKPMFGNRSGKQQKTHFIIFYKHDKMLK